MTAAPTGLALLREWRTALDRPLTLPEGGLRYVLEPGRGLRDVVRDLRMAGAPGATLWLLWTSRLSGQAARLQAGEYQLRPGTTTRALLDMLVAGQVVQHSFTLVEGWTFAQVVEAMGRQGALTRTLDGLTPEAVMERLGTPGVHPEGRFLPETYHFPRGTTDVELLRRAYRDMAAALERAWQDREVRVPLKTPDEALTLASIVEKETARADERARVAGVLLRRLQRGMRLQVDPTVIYALGTGFDGDLRRADLERDSPYNTYTRAGLPPTPIAMPGRASIQATLRPEEGSALFYVSRGDGSHHFSDSHAEHQRAVLRYQLSGAQRAGQPAGSGGAP